MRMQMQLNRQTVSDLQTLIRLNIDSAEGFRHAAEQIKNARLVEVFREIAAERTEQAHQLQTLVAVNDEEPKDEGSYVASAHRTWMDLRTALGGGDKAVLDEEERGEDAIKQEYERVLASRVEPWISELLRRQYSSVKAVHDRIRDLRDACAASGDKWCNA